MMNYPHLFTPGTIGPMRLKNRIVQGPAELQAAGYNGEMSDDYIDFYEKSAKAGTGLIITAYASVDDEFSQSFAGPQLKLTDRRHVAGMSKLARRVHKYGAKVMVQAYMAGRQAVPSRITGKRMVAPSPIGYSCHDQIPEEMTTAEIREAVKKFGRAARILYDAGIDGIEILAAGGYLINQFLSEKSNQRTDEYGGSFENRTRFVKEVVDEIRLQCPKNFAISIRFSADEFLDGGYGLKEGVEFAKFFEQIGVDCININNANQEKRYYIIEPVGFKSGWKNYIIKAVKDAVSIPVLSTNVIKKPEQAEAMLAAGLADFAVMSRAFLADTEWACKAREGRGDEIKNCIGCLYCLEQTAANRRSICAVNPRLLREDEFPDQGRDMEGKRVLVIGAGPSGMEAAMVCAQRGAEVTVYEKRDYIGGAVALGARTPDKDPLQWLVDYYQTMADKYGITIKRNTAVTAEQIIAQQPFAVFVGCGAKPVILPCAQPDSTRILTVEQVLDQQLKFQNEKIAVVGGGMTGCEVAELYAMAGNQVTLIEMQDKLAPEVDPDNLVTVLENLDKANATVLMSHRLATVNETGVVATRLADGVEVTIPADRIILSLGGRPNNTLYQELAGALDNVIAVGDTDKVGRAASAIQSGYEKAYTLQA